MAGITLGNYGASVRTDSSFGQGGLVTLVVDDDYSNSLPYPYAENVIRVTKSVGEAAQIFYMPEPSALPRGHCSNFLYSNGNRDITFQNVVGGVVNINGSTTPKTYAASAGRELLIVTCDNSGWRIHRIIEATGGGGIPAFDSTQADVQIGSIGTPILQYTIPGNVISLTNQKDILILRVDLTHDTGGPNDETQFGWVQAPETPKLIFSGQCPSTPAQAWLEMAVTFKEVEGTPTVFFHWVDHCSTGGVAVGRYSTPLLDLSQPWDLFFSTDSGTTLTTFHTISYEAKRYVV